MSSDDAPPPLLGRAGTPRAAGRRIREDEPGVRVPAMPRSRHNEAPLPFWERGGEPGARWAHEPG